MNRKNQLLVAIPSSIALLLVGMLLLGQIDLFSTQLSPKVFAANSPCKSAQQATEMVDFDYPQPPQSIEARGLQCIVPDHDLVIFIYDEEPLTQDSFRSMKIDSSVIVRASDFAGNSTTQVDAVEAYERIHEGVIAERPDLKPQLMTIAGYPAWGTEGGDNLFITDVLDENGTLEERLTSAAPSTLMVTKGDISYSFEAYLPLSELIEMAESFTK